MTLNNPYVSQWDLSDQGLLAWSFDPVAAGATMTLATGVMHVAKIKVTKPCTVTSVILYLNTNGTSLTAGQSFLSLYSSSKALLSSSADQAAAWVGGAGLKTINLAVAQAIPAGYCYVGIYSVGSTPPTFRIGGGNLLIVNSGLAAAASRFALADSGLTTAPPSTLGTFTAGTSPLWFGLI